MSISRSFDYAIARTRDSTGRCAKVSICFLDVFMRCLETDLVLQRIHAGLLWDQIGQEEFLFCLNVNHRVVGHCFYEREVQQPENQNMKIRNIIAALVAVVAINVANAQAPAQAPAPAPQTFQLGEIVRDAQGNEYKVVLEPVRKVVAATPQVIAQPAPAAVAAPAQVTYAQPAQVVYAQQPQGNGLGKYVGDTVITGAGGAAQGAILGAVTGRNVGKEALGMGAGAAGGKVAGDLLNGIFRR